MNRAMTLLRSSRLMLLVCLVTMTWVGAAQQPPPRAPTPVTTNFTGTVASLDASDVRSVRFQYAAGARSHWHSHAGIQVLILEQGKGRAQVQGRSMQELVPGQPVQLPAAVPHWHGAAPDQGLVQIATTVGTATWMGPVSDTEYLGKQ